MSPHHLPKPSMGILHANHGARKFRLTRHVPSGELGFFVKHFWIVSWDITGQEPYRQEIVPNPCANLVVEKGKTFVYAPTKAKYSYLLQGKGCVFGAKFKPGGYYPFVQRPISELAEQPVHVHDVFGVDALTLESSILTQTDEGQMVEIAERLLSRRLPQRDDNIILINQIVERILADRAITRVEQICKLFSLNIRKLQRLFDQYVGVSPKWVIKLYRLQNAAEAMDHGHSSDLLRLSLDLGYYDQSHFIKDFKALIGTTPDEYVRQINVK